MKTKRRKKLIVCAGILLILVIAGYWYLFMGSRITDAGADVTKGREDTNSLVVYFTRTGETRGNIDAVSSATINSNSSLNVSDTEAAALMIQELTGADMYQIRTKKYYRNSYLGTAATSLIEEMLNMRPALAAQPESLGKYDVIYIGYPIWWFNAPMAVGTFMESYELEGKTVIPFCTSQDNGIDVSLDYIREISGNATVLEGMRIHDSDIEDVAKWLSGLGVLERDNNINTLEKDADDNAAVTVGTETQRGFINDNTLHSEIGDIHYSSYIPESYDGSRPYALFITLPGWEGLYFQGTGTNMVEDYGTEALKYNSEMIVLSPQLEDWGETSADMTIALTEYFLKHYNIDTEKVYLEGLSGGGETGSIVMGKKPELYTAYLGASSQWNGELKTLARARTPVYLAIGEDDTYYGSDSFKDTYDKLYKIYEDQGLTAAEIDKILILDVKDGQYFADRGFRDQHAGGASFAHEEDIMGWLFGEH